MMGRIYDKYYHDRKNIIRKVSLVLKEELFRVKSK